MKGKGWLWVFMTTGKENKEKEKYRNSCKININRINKNKKT